MSSPPGRRFLIRRPDGDEVPVASVEELQRLIERGEVPPGCEIFDASTEQWSAAAEMPVYRFIVEELALEAGAPQDEVPGATARDDGPRDDVAREDSEEDPQDEDSQENFRDEDPQDDSASEDPQDDPFLLPMDLVDTDPLGSGGGDESRRDTSPSGTEAEEAPGTGDEWVEGKGGARDERGSGTGEVPPSDPRSADAAGDAGGEGGRTARTGGSGPVSSGRDGAEEGSAGSGPSGADDLDLPDEEDWFTPASEGGMLLEGVETEGPAEPPVEIWQPEEGEADALPARKHGRYAARPRVVGLLLVAGLAAGAWLLLPSSEPADWVEEERVRASRTLVPPPVPTFPAGLDATGTRAIEGIGATFLTVGDSLRTRHELDGGPPAEWLSGFYLANAGDFPGVEEFWSGYIDFLDDLEERDREVYERGVREALAGEDDLSREEEDRLRSHFDERYRLRESFRQYRYHDLRETAGAALRLHELLIRHQEAIRYSPALGQGVSADPILEAVMPDETVRREIERALDQVFRALDRSRGGGPPASDGLRAELFQRFGDASVPPADSEGSTTNR